MSLQKLTLQSCLRIVSKGIRRFLQANHISVGFADCSNDVVQIDIAVVDVERRDSKRFTRTNWRQTKQKDHRKRPCEQECQSAANYQNVIRNERMKLWP